MTVIAHFPPIWETHLSVAFWELCDTAMKLTRGNLFANRRSSRKVFSATDIQLAGILTNYLNQAYMGIRSVSRTLQYSADHPQPAAGVNSLPGPLYRVQVLKLSQQAVEEE
jgi:hypothetical protein